MDVPFESIMADFTRNCRGEAMPSDIMDLRESIERNGLIQPLTVTPVGDQYRLIAGFTRYKCIELIRKRDETKFQTVPVHVMPADEIQAKVINLEENLKRRDLSILDEANAIRQLLAIRPDLNLRRLSEKLGFSQNWVKVRLALLDLEPEIQEAAVNGLIETRTILQFQPLDHEKRLSWLKNLKEAKIRGIKAAPRPVDLNYTKLNEIKRNTRSRYEIFLMQSHIRENMGNGIGTRLLAWAAGEIATNEVIEDLKDILGEDYKSSEELSKLT